MARKLGQIIARGQTTWLTTVCGTLSAPTAEYLKAYGFQRSPQIRGPTPKKRTKNDQKEMRQRIISVIHSYKLHNVSQFTDHL